VSIALEGHFNETQGGAPPPLLRACLAAAMSELEQARESFDKMLTSNGGVPAERARDQMASDGHSAKPFTEQQHLKANNTSATCKLIELGIRRAVATTPTAPAIPQSNRHQGATAGAFVGF